MKDLSWLRTLPGKPLIVAEVKMVSPYGWVNPTCKLWWDAFLLCREVGDIISIHTDPLWGGSFADIESARQETDKPILAKGFHPTIKHVEKAFAAGADYCLTVGWWPGDERCWHECESGEQLIHSEAPRRVWNARNPRTGQIVHSTDWLGSMSGWICQASCIKGPQDVAPNVKAILIGEGLYS